jgi:endoglucanase
MPMRPQSKDFLVRLLNVPGPTNFETPVQRIWRKNVEPHADRLEIDTYGNNTAILEGSQKLSVMIVGHADEIGLIVKRIDSSGMLWFGTIGGIDPTILAGSRVRVLAKRGEVPGVIGFPAIHLTPRGEQPKIPKIGDLSIDIGAKSKREAERLLAVGDPVIFGEDFREMAGGFASHRAFDNRVGCYIVAEVMRELRANRRRKAAATVYGVSSVQEETGVWGAGLVAYRYMPTVAVAVDVTHDTSTPGVSKTTLPDVVCGKGPVLSRGIRNNRMLVDQLEAAARSAKVPYQVEIDEGHTGTDADAISNRKTGIPVATLSIACRYMHTPCEVIHLGDLTRAVALLTRFVQNLSEKMSFIPR